MTTRYGFVGRGRAARALAPLVAESEGATLAWWWSLGEPDGPATLGPVDVVVFAVPDGALEAAATSLSARTGAAREIWLHLAGSRPGELLRTSAVVPRAAGCMHPLVALTGRPDRALLAGATAGVDGEPDALGPAEALARRLGLEPRRLVPGTKALYHAAAVTVAGHAVALFAEGLALLGRCGLDPEAARAALQPLMRGAVAHLADASPEQAITGPITRGDATTVAAHLAALDALGDASALALYRELARRALALSAPRLEPPARAAIDALLAEP